MKSFRNLFFAVMLIGGLVALTQPDEAKAQNVAIVSELGGKCMDASGGTSKGARLIGYACSPGKNNQIFWFNANGTITQGGFCLDASGGLGRSGDQIALWDCNGQPNQKWAIQSDGTVRGIGGKCLDLQYGDNPTYWIANALTQQSVILWDCHGGNNQKWNKAIPIQSGPRSSRSILVAPGSRGNVDPFMLTAKQASELIGAGGLNLINLDGGTLVGGPRGGWLLVVKN